MVRRRNGPQHSTSATGFFRRNESGRQSRKATFRIAFDWPSVFITTRCQPCSVTVAHLGSFGFRSFHLKPLEMGGFLT